MNQLSWGAHIVPVIDCFNPTKQICSSVGVQHTKQGGKYRVIEASLPAPNCSAVIHQPNKTIDTINSPISLYTSGDALDFLDFLGCLKIVIPLNPCFSDHFPHSKKWPKSRGSQHTNGKQQPFSSGLWSSEKRPSCQIIFPAPYSPVGESMTGWCRVTRPESPGKIIINSPLMRFLMPKKCAVNTKPVSWLNFQIAVRLAGITSTWPFEWPSSSKRCPMTPFPIGSMYGIY